MISQKWINQQKALLSQCVQGEARDALAAEIDAAEKANTDARAEHLVAGSPGGPETVSCLHCKAWNYTGRPVVHSSRCGERDNRAAQPIIDLSVRLQNAERKALDYLRRG